MRYREISHFLGKFLLYFSLALLAPIFFSFLYEMFLINQDFTNFDTTVAFLETFGITVAAGALFLLLGGRGEKKMYRRESLLLVALIWIICCGLSSLPFIFTNTLSNPIDAYFESVSGYTTTGSSIMYPKNFDEEGNEIPYVVKSPYDGHTYTFYGNVDPLINKQTGKVIANGIAAIPKPLLFWRSFMQWLGGMGIIVLFIAIFPALAIGGRFLFAAEATGPTKEAMTPRIKETASLLWKIYLALTLLETLLLFFTNSKLSLFEAITVSFSTISTGGFSIYDNSFFGYTNLDSDWIVTIFMAVGSVNFALYFYILKGKVYRLYQPEFFTHAAILVTSSVIMSLFIYNTPKYLFGTADGTFSLSEAFRYGSFQAVSAQTSTGFSIANYDLWPQACQVLILLLMYVGGMSGSTAGGIKISRLCILFKLAINKIELIFRPETVRPLKLGSREISQATGMNVLIFFSLIMFFSAAGTFIYVLDGIDPKTAIGLVGTFINNNGLSFGLAGPIGTCAFLPTISKLFSIIWMLLGRLELFALLLLFVPAFWRTKG